MTKMRAVDAAVKILELEGATQTFGLPGAAINPFYDAMRKHDRGTHPHVLARHVEGASHMAEGYTRAKAGNIGICIGTSGPAGTDMITGLYSASADSIPILCITGQAPVARLHKEDFQAVDIASIAKPVTKWAIDGARAGAGAGRVPAGLPPDALRPSRPGADRPAVRRADGRDRLRPRHLHAAAGLQAGRDPGPDRQGAGHAVRGRAAADRRRRRHHQRRRRRPAGRVRRDPERAGRPDPDGLGRDPRRPPADGRHGRAADLAPLRQRDHAGVRLRARHRQPLGQPAHRRPGHLPHAAGRFVHVDIEPTQIGRVFAPDYGIVSDAKAALELFVEAAKERQAEPLLPDCGVWVKDCQQRKHTLQRRTHFDDVPIKPQRVYEEMNRAFGRDTRYVSTIGLSQIAGGQFLHVYGPRHWINAGQAGPLGWTLPAALGVCAADPDADRGRPVG